MLKRCFRCGVEKPKREFYRHPMMGDGRLGKCKECTKADVRANRLARLDYYRKYDVRRFHEDPMRRASTYEHSERWNRRYPKRKRAQTMVHHALRSGKLMRQPCEKCGAENVHAHHDDYSKPLAVRWLCPVHHAEWHRLNP